MPITGCLPCFPSPLRGGWLARCSRFCFRLLMAQFGRCSFAISCHRHCYLFSGHFVIVLVFLFLFLFLFLFPPYSGSLYVHLLPQRSHIIFQTDRCCCYCYCRCSCCYCYCGIAYLLRAADTRPWVCIPSEVPAGVDSVCGNVFHYGAAVLGPDLVTRRDMGRMYIGCLRGVYLHGVCWMTPGRLLGVPWRVNQHLPQPVSSPLVQGAPRHGECLGMVVW